MREGAYGQYLTDSVLHDGTPLSETSRPQGQGQGSERAADQDDHNPDEDDDDGCDCRDDDFAADDVADEGGWTCTARHGDSCDCVANTGMAVSTLHQTVLTCSQETSTLPLAHPPQPRNNCCTSKRSRLDCPWLNARRGVRAVGHVRTASRSGESGQSNALIEGSYAHARSVPLTIRPINNLGLGAFYTPSNFEPLPQGRFIALYAGEYLTTPQARARWSSASSSAEKEEEGKGNYILSLRVGTANDEVWHIDPRYRGNVGRFLNHSCEPNCVIHLVYWGAGAHSWPRAAIFVRSSWQAVL